MSLLTTASTFTASGVRPWRQALEATRRGALALVALAVLSGAAVAQDYPNRPIRIVVPYPAGGSTDAISRMIGLRLAARLNQPVTVENKGGATEQVAAAYVKNQPGDGYTIMLTTMAGMTTNPALYGNKLPYDPVKDFSPVILAVTLPSIVMVHPSNPSNTMTELTSWLKAKKGDVSYSSSGAGTAAHIAMEMYKRMGDFEATHVPYRGGAPGMQGLMAGETQIMIAIGAESMPMAKGGKMKPIAVTSAGRSAAFPGLPAVSESPGLAGFEMPFWFAYVVPAATPKDIVAKLSRELDAILHEPETSKKLQDMGTDVVGGPPDRLAALIKSDTVKWAKVIGDAHITID